MRFISRTMVWSCDSRLPPDPACFSLCEAGPGFRHIQDRLFLVLPPQLLLRILKKLTLNLGMGSAFRQAGLESQLCPSTSSVNWGSYTTTPSQGSSLLVGDSINRTRLFFNLMRIIQVTGWQLAGQRVILYLQGAEGKALLKVRALDTSLVSPCPAPRSRYCHHHN